MTLKMDPADTKTEDGDRVLKQIALSLDWINVPPLDVLVKDIRARAVGARLVKTQHDELLAVCEAIRTKFAPGGWRGWRGMEAEIAMLEAAITNARAK